jgi:hypothetical protein
VFPRTAFQQPGLADCGGSHDHRVRTQSEQLVELGFGANAAGHLDLDIPTTQNRFDRRVVVAQVTRAIQVDDVDSFGADVGEGRGNVRGIVRVHSRM